MQLPRLQIQGLSQRLGTRLVLDGVGFAVQPGEAFGLLGPNGSGKSTLIRALLGLLIPDTGELHLDGVRVEPGDRRLRSQLGVVFQSPSLDAKLTALENLRLAATLCGLFGRAADDRIRALLALAELETRATEPVATLSGGMRRRLEIARALLGAPRLLVMDEPTTGLDEHAYQRLWGELERLRQEEGMSLLVTTHRSDEAERCDRLAVLDEGRLVAEGTPAALKARVSGDVVTLEAADPEALVAEVHALGLPAQVVDGSVVITHERGHELIPRLVEAFPGGRIRSLAMRRPTLSDAFLALTGKGFGRSSPGEAAA